jgi:predicted secreted protein
MSDLRSKRCIFLAHCILAQCVRANGVAKYFAAALKPVVQFCLDNDINMMQMPCPESQCSAGGLGREPHGKQWYEQRGLREKSSEIAKSQSLYIADLINNGFEVLGILGMEFSPACAVNLLNKGPVIYKAEGIYIEELKKELHLLNVEVPIVGVNQRALKKLSRDLGNLIRPTEAISGSILLTPKVIKGEKKQLDQASLWEQPADTVE